MRIAVHCRRATLISLVLAYWTWLRLNFSLLKGTVAMWPTTLKPGPWPENWLQRTWGKGEQSHKGKQAWLYQGTWGSPHPQEGSPPALLLVPTDRHTGTILALDTALGRWHLIQLPDTSNRHQRSILGALHYKQMVWHPPLETNGECWMPRNSPSKEVC